MPRHRSQAAKRDRAPRDRGRFPNNQSDIVDHFGRPMFSRYRTHLMPDMELALLLTRNHPPSHLYSTAHRSAAAVTYYDPVSKKNQKLEFFDNVRYKYPGELPVMQVGVSSGGVNHAARVITSAFRSNAERKQARRDEALQGLARSSLPPDTWRSIYASSDLPPRSIGKVGLHAMGLQRRVKRSRRKRARR